MVAVTHVNRFTMSAIARRLAGVSSFPEGFSTIKENDSVVTSLLLPASLKTFEPVWGSPIVWPLSMIDWEFCPPRATLAIIRPMVKTNQSARTGQRWRELQTATLTVHGSRLRAAGPAVSSLSTCCLLRAAQARLCLARGSQL